MRRILLVLALLVVAAIGAGVWYLLTNLNAMVAREIERTGTEVAGTPVSVGRVAIGLREGSARVGEVAIRNPQGFGGGDVFQLGEIAVDLDPARVREQPLVIDEVVIAGPKVFFALDGRARSNVEELLDHLKRSGGGSGQGGASQAPVRLRIRRFVFRDGELEADTTAVGGKTLRLAMPPLTLRDLGGSAGAEPGEIARQVLRAYAQSVTRQVGKSELRGKPDRVIEKKLGGELGEAAKGLLDSLFD